MIKRTWAVLRTIRVRILLIVALCWLLPTLVLGVYMSSIFIDALTEKTKQTLVSGAARAEDQTIAEIKNLIAKSRRVTYDEVVYRAYLSYANGKSDYEGFYVSTRSYWQRMYRRDANLSFAGFFLLSDPARVIHTSDLPQYLDHFVQQAQPTLLEIGQTLDTRSRFVSINQQLFHVRNLYSPYMERFGMMALEIVPERLFASLYATDTLWQGDADIMLDDFVVLSPQEHSQHETLAQPVLGLQESGDELYLTREINTPDFRLAYRLHVSKDRIYGQVQNYYNIILALALLLLPIEALIMLLIHRSLTKPITQLAKATRRLAGGELGVTVPSKRTDEIGQLGESFNMMSLRIQELIDKSYREELALRDARIEALQSRINPHFLNNALELINWQARMEGDETVGNMIHELSVLINAALDRFDECMVPIALELKVADAYFFFIEQRFLERITIDKQIDDTLMHVNVPRLCIQTLLENAVEHGVAPKGGGWIRLSIYQSAGNLYIDVRNNGKGLSGDEQAKIHDLLTNESRDFRSEHLGIRNVNTRLKLIYGDRASLALSVDAHGDTLARITIPFGMEPLRIDADAHR